MNRFWRLSVLICFLIIIDQLTKGWVQSSFYLGEGKVIIDGFFSLTYVRNTGAAFGFGAGAHDTLRMLMFLALPTVFSFWITWMLIKTIKGPFHMSLAYALILAGAVGNLIDRFSLGYVVDMFFFYYKTWEFAVFNFADSCITVAAFILIGDMLWNMKHNKPSAEGPA